MSAYQFRGVAPAQQGNWDWRAAGNFIGGGTGTGFLLVAALVAMGGLPVWPLALIGLAFVGGGLFCVWLEVGRPWRAMNVFFHPQTSWMSREAVVAVPLFGVGGLALLLNEPWPLLAAAVLGMLFLFAQANILQAAKGIPAWREPLIVPFIISTGIAEGGGLLLALLAAAGVVPVWLPPVFLFAVIVRFVWWRMYLARLFEGVAPMATRRTARALNKPFFWAGHVAPSLLLALGLAVPPAGAPAFILAGLAVMLAGWWIKLAIVTRLAHEQGFAIPVSPRRGAGAAGPGARPGWE